MTLPGKIIAFIWPPYDPLRFAGAEAFNLPTPAPSSENMYILRNETINRQLVKAISGIDIDKLTAHHTDFSVMVFIFNNSTDTARSKRMAIQQSANEEILYPATVDNHCLIRAQNNQGHIIGDLLILTGENLRNPFLGIARSIYAINKGDEEPPEAVKQLLETINSITDLALGIFLSPAYPLSKYASAKALKSIGHAINNDMACLKQEFVLEEIVQMLADSVELFEYHYPSTYHRRLHKIYQWHSIPAELKKVSPFKPEGLFVHEDMRTGIYQVKYVVVDYKGERLQIIEKQTGQYYLFKVQNNITDEKPVYFDQATNTIHLNIDLPAGQGLDYTVVNGPYFIEIYGIRHEIMYDKQLKTLMLMLHKPDGKIDFTPVYMELLSKTWHLTTHNKFPVFTTTEQNIINNISVNIKNHYSYKAFPNTNPVLYGDGKIYRDALFYRDGPYVEMNGKLVPLRQIPFKKPAIAYEVFDLKLPEKQGYSIEWDGNRWIFEKASSPNLSSELNRLLTAERFEEEIDMRTLSAADSHGLRWNARNQSFLKVQYRYIKVNKLTSHRYSLAATPTHPAINLRFKHNLFVIETAEERLHWLSGARLSKYPKSPRRVLESQPNFDNKSASELLSAYHFPYSGLFSEYAFVLDIEQTGKIPSWATPFKKCTPLQKTHSTIIINSVSIRTKANETWANYPLNLYLGEHLNSAKLGNVFVDASDKRYVIKIYFNDMFKDRNDLLLHVQREADIAMRYYGSDAGHVFYTKNDLYYLRMYHIPGQTLASLPANSLPKTALERFVDMIDKLHKLGIQYGDLSDENILWHHHSNTFYPFNVNTIENIHDYYKVHASSTDKLNPAQANKIKEKIAEKIIG